jgi:hypothetical protein
MIRILCFFGLHRWSEWQLNGAYGDRQERHCPCGERQERKI